MNELALTHLTALSSFGAYLLSSVLFLVWGLLRRESLGKYGVKISLGAFILHSVALVSMILSERSIFSGNFGDYLFGVAWGVTLLYLIAQRKRSYPLLGAFVVPSVCLILASSSWLIHVSSGVSVGEISKVLLILHVMPAVIAEVSFVSAVLLSAIFLWQDNKLKERSIDIGSLSSPSLRSLDSWNSNLIWVAFSSMSLAVLSGSVWAISIHHSLLRNDYRTISALLCWVTLGVILHLRIGRSFSAKRISKFTLIGAAFVFSGLAALIVFGGQSLHAL